MQAIRSASPKTLTIFAAGLAVTSIGAFVIGMILLGIGFAMPEGAGGRGGSSGGRGAGNGATLSSEAPAKADIDDGVPVGLYFMTRFWPATGSLEKAIWYFTDDGKVYRNLGTGFSDEALAQHTGPQGTAVSDGDAMVITWSDGRETRSEVEPDGKSFAWDMGIFTPIKPFDDESQLVGKWEGGESITVSGGGASAARSIELREDGTFSQSSTGSVTAESEDSVVTGGSSSATSGRWEMNDYALALTYGDGRVVQGVSFPYDDGESERFFFNGTMYRRIE